MDIDGYTWTDKPLEYRIRLERSGRNLEMCFRTESEMLDWLRENEPPEFEMQCVTKATCIAKPKVRH